MDLRIPPPRGQVISSVGLDALDAVQQTVEAVLERITSVIQRSKRPQTGVYGVAVQVKVPLPELSPGFFELVFADASLSARFGRKHAAAGGTMNVGADGHRALLDVTGR